MNTTNPRDYLLLLETFRIGLLHRLIERKEIVDWADAIIQKEDVPDYLIGELSLCQSQPVGKTVSLLSEYIGEDGPEISARVVLGMVYKQYIRKQITLQKAIHAACRIILDAELTGLEQSRIYGMDDSYSLAETKTYGTIEEVENDFLNFMKIYDRFSIDNFMEWQTIEDKIEQGVIRLSNEEKKTPNKKQKPWWKFWL